MSNLTTSYLKNHTKVHTKVPEHYFLSFPDNKTHLVVRTESRFFDITDRPINHDGHIDDNNGLIPDAVEIPTQTVADLYAEEIVRNERLGKIETLLMQWLDIRRARLRRAKESLKLQKQEVRN